VSTLDSFFDVAYLCVRSFFDFAYLCLNFLLDYVGILLYWFGKLCHTCTQSCLCYEIWNWIVNVDLMFLKKWCKVSFDSLKWTIGQRWELPDQKEEISILLPDTHIILFGFILRNASEFRLEVQCISHLIEKEGQEEVTPIGIEIQPTCRFNSDNVFTPLPALWENISQWPTDKTSDI